MISDGKSPLTTRHISANGLTFETLECGDGDRLVLCLHGFPSHAMCWRFQMPMLARLGYRVWAPNQRGYGNSSRPAGVENYLLDRLLEDVAAIIDASGARSTVLMAHDWGGLVAWFFAIRKIRPLDKLVIMNVPHPACAAVAFRQWKQLRKSWYIAAFQIPWLPDFIMRLGRAWMTGRLMTGAAHGADVFPPEMLDLYRNSAAAPGAMTAMLNWYRGLARAGVPPEMKTGFQVIETP